MATTASIPGFHNGNEGAIYISTPARRAWAGGIEPGTSTETTIAAAVWGGRLAYATAADGVLVGDLDARGKGDRGRLRLQRRRRPRHRRPAPRRRGGRVEVHLPTSYLSVSSTLSNAAELTLGGEATGDEVGAALIAPETLDQDGYDDLVIGAPGRDGGAGAAYVVLGRSDTDLSIIGRSMSLADADVLLTGDAAGDAFGASLSSGGDLNGDTFVELDGRRARRGPGQRPRRRIGPHLRGAADDGLRMPVFANLDGIQEGGAVGASRPGAPICLRTGPMTSSSARPASERAVGCS